MLKILLIMKKFLLILIIYIKKWEFRGKNLVKILYEKRPEDEKYYSYVMELSSIGSLSDFHKYLDKKLIFKDPFIEKIGDNLMRFFAIQMVNGLRTLFEGNLVISISILI